MPRIAVAFAFVLAPMLVAAQSASDIPKISVSTRLVEIGVIVRDKNGPVENLTKDDFVVLDRGKPQKISLFSIESAKSAVQLSQPQPGPQSLPQNTFSDLPQYGTTVPNSITIVLLDNLNTLYGSTPESKYEASPYWMEDLALQNARAHLIEFIKNLQSQDRVAIYGLSDSLRVLCDFTSDRQQLLAILKSYDTKSITNRRIVEPGDTLMDLGGHAHHTLFGQGDRFENGASSRLAASANEDRGALTMAALQSIAAHVANIPGRKNLVWLTANLPFSGAAMAHVLSPANIAVYPVDARGLLARSVATALVPGTADADEVSGAAGHFDNMPAQSARPIGIAAMQKVADETGGQAFVNTNDITGAIRKAIEDSAVTYTLGFYIDRSSLDGKFHEVKIQVKGSALTVRYPKGYFALEDVPATKDQSQTSLTTAIQSPIESSSIPMHVNVGRLDRTLPSSYGFSGSIDIHHLQLAQNGNRRTGAIDVFTVEQNETGEVLRESHERINLHFTDEEYAAKEKSGILFSKYIPPLPGATTLRILVEDSASAKVGSVIIPLSEIH